MRTILLAVATAVPLSLATIAVAQTPRPTAPPNAPGATAPAARLSEVAILRALEARGYTDIRTVNQNGDEYHMQAKHNGRQVLLVVNARTGTYTESAG